MGKHRLFTSKRDDFESNTLSTLANFLGIKAAGRQRQLVDHSLDQRRFPGSRAASEQDFLVQIHFWQCLQNQAVRPPIVADFSSRPQRGHLPRLPR